MKICLWCRKNGVTIRIHKGNQNICRSGATAATSAKAEYQCVIRFPQCRIYAGPPVRTINCIAATGDIYPLPHILPIIRHELEFISHVPCNINGFDVYIIKGAIILQDNVKPVVCHTWIDQSKVSCAIQRFWGIGRSRRGSHEKRGLRPGWRRRSC